MQFYLHENCNIIVDSILLLTSLLVVNVICVMGKIMDKAGLQNIFLNVYLGYMPGILLGDVKFKQEITS